MKKKNVTYKISFEITDKAVLDIYTVKDYKIWIMTEFGKDEDITIKNFKINEIKKPKGMVFGKKINKKGEKKC